MISGGVSGTSMTITNGRPKSSLVRLAAAAISPLPLAGEGPGVRAADLTVSPLPLAGEGPGVRAADLTVPWGRWFPAGVAGVGPAHPPNAPTARATESHLQIIV